MIVVMVDRSEVPPLAGVFHDGSPQANGPRYFCLPCSTAEATLETRHVLVSTQIMLQSVLEEGFPPRARPLLFLLLSIAISTRHTRICTDKQNTVNLPKLSWISPSCLGYGQSEGASESCLTLNVVRPSGTKLEDKLPVAVWTYGGGYTSGSSADQRYNLSFIVDQSVQMGTPIVAVSFNYRLHCWGFMWSQENKEVGVGNLGFRDERLALHWVQESMYPEMSRYYCPLLNTDANVMK